MNTGGIDDEKLNLLLDTPIEDIKFNNGVMIKVVEVSDNESIVGGNTSNKNGIIVQDVEVKDGQYVYLDDENIKNSAHTCAIYRKLLIALLLLIIISVIAVVSILILTKNNNNNNDIISNKNTYIFIKGDSRKDDYGVELNFYLLDGKNSTQIEDDPLNNNLCQNEPCPIINPSSNSKYIKNLSCEEDSTLQLINFEENDGKGSPASLNLHTISDQIENWEKWEKEENDFPTNYGMQTIEQLLSQTYHPYNYGYTGKDTSSIDDKTYYMTLIQSQISVIPDPRRRRVFSFILLDSELDLLDTYISENYNAVDYFIILEADVSLTDNPKPFYFSEALQGSNRYDKFKDKLIPLPFEMKDFIDGNSKNYIQQIEKTAKLTLINKGLKVVHARHGDIYIFGHLNEMLDSNTISLLKKCGGWEHLVDGYGVSVSKTNAINNKNGVKFGVSLWDKKHYCSLNDDSTNGTLTNTSISIFNVKT